MIADEACERVLREEFFISRSTAADESELREEDCGRKMYCLLYLLIQQEVRDVELLEVRFC